jgi:hypothetical protein
MFTRSAGVWTQQGGKLVGSGYVDHPWQGVCVRLSSDGNTAIVGGPYDSGGTGAAWIFTRNNGTWTQEGNKLVGTGWLLYPNQGSSVAISADANTVALGGPDDNFNQGGTWVFVRKNGVWVQEGSKLIGTGGSPYAYQGSSVALSADGNTLAVGGRGDLPFGATWIFTRRDGIWAQQGGKLVGSATGRGPQQGGSVDLSADGNTLIVGGRLADTAGAAWIFRRISNVWSQQGGRLVGLDASMSAEIGVSVSLSGDGNVALVGGDNDNSYAGAAWVFECSGGVWTEPWDKLVGRNADGSAHQGIAVALSGDASTAMVGGSFDAGGAGGAWMFKRIGTDVPELHPSVPSALVLEQNYPNPFNPSTTIRYALPGAADVELTVLNLLGQTVARLVDKRQGAGYHELTFDGSSLASGVYLCRLLAGGNAETRKLILLK